MTDPVGLGHLLVLVILVAAAAATVFGQSLLASVIVLSVMGVATTVVLAFLQAVDVAMAEAVIGTGLLTALFLAALGQTWRPR